jgi:tRNA uridine 5-carboxymethylaminomethyl modification enzyme
MAVEVLVRHGVAAGIRTGTGQEYFAPAVILTSGTFLNGTIHIGENQYGGGRAGERAAVGLTESLEALGFESDRLKTGTPPRIDGRTVDFAAMEVQPGDEEPSPFSFMTDSLPSEQMSCWLTRTSTDVHDVLRTGFDRSPMFNGRIQGVGPRYCPSIEDKIHRFADKDQHQLFIEPEGRRTHEMYVNGFSTSLPEDVQFKALRAVPGMQHVHMLRPGYAIEYDYFPPYQVRYSLETKRVPGLFFAGQINGTTGYEEAAAQGLIAGVNAVRLLGNQEPIVLKRSEAYVGVLIDDLVAKGTDEPYRMFTSRAEHRILLRQDNADFRLTDLGYEIGLASAERMERMRRKREAVQTTLHRLHKTSVSPDLVNGFLESVGSSPISEGTRLQRLVLRPEVGLKLLLEATGLLEETVVPIEGMEPAEAIAETEIKYAGYVTREHETVSRMERLESVSIPEAFEYADVGNISMEAREKLEKIRPENVGQASRISGVSPADISVLLVLLKRHSGSYTNGR